MTDPLLEVRQMSVDYGRGRGRLRALDGVDLSVTHGESLGIVGESGCGKSTLARAITGLVRASQGELIYDGEPLSARRSAAQRRQVQMVFQDPSSSLNPRMAVGSMLRELLRYHKLVDRDGVEARSVELLELVGLPAKALGAFPGQLSGGQRQRVGIARALALEPRLLIADEAVSALDVSVQAAVLNLFTELRRNLGLTMIFISHNLAVVRNVCDNVAVMYLGRVVETGTIDQVFDDPQHPYTKALLETAPRMHGLPLGTAAPLGGEPPSPLAVPAGCRFHPRCPAAAEECREIDPPAVERDGHAASCLFAWQWEPSKPIALSVGTNNGEKP